MMHAGRRFTVDYDAVSSCKILLMPMVLQVVGFGRDFGRHSGPSEAVDGLHRQSCLSHRHLLTECVLIA